MKIALKIMALDVKVTLSVDSSEYEILTDAVRSIKDIDGFTCEIGIRGGGSSGLIMLALKENGDNKIHIGIDPFGDIDYRGWETEAGITQIDHIGYANNMKRETLRNLYLWCWANNAEFLYFCMEDTEFFGRFSDGVPLYDKQRKEIVNRYALVFIDGQHTEAAVRAAVDFFHERLSPGGVLVFDDIPYYPHYRIEEHLFDLGYELVDKRKLKASYRKVI